MAEAEASPLARFTRRRLTTFAALATYRCAPLAELDIPARRVATIVWQRRHANEQASVALAERMISAAHAIGTSRNPEVIPALTRLSRDEQAHVTACASVLETLGAPLAAPQPLRPHPSGEEPMLSFSRDVLMGLVVCETVSAARFAVVRRHTDILAIRRLIDAFLRDEVAHAGLGFALVPIAIHFTTRVLGAQRGKAWICRELLSAMAELEDVVGLDGARRGLPPVRPQPKGNPGIVEPGLDARAFYDAVTRRILPRLDACRVDITHEWRHRFDVP